ncbi:conserved hypothetical protein [Rhodococcus sp. RD6.2]|uniref:ATP-binding protein n=1 Tax=Rhodococcus sp. RD6.2 TaxID=260936 RepID=UPI00063B6C48|nr:AAA family ATPase [Rhodococcus sp. RD6.2]CRK54471.1 conserved hypothetical protein [Rhodococcus sp. RD6.2]
MTSVSIERFQPLLDEAGISIIRVEEREFPGEHWVIIFVSESEIAAGQSLAGSIERRLVEGQSSSADPVTVIFRAERREDAPEDASSGGGRLSDKSVDRLIQLLEARSRTSDAVPSLRYMEDPRASLPAIAASRHHVVYGRRGVGKTALLLEAKRLVQEEGHVAVWINAHTLRSEDAISGFGVIADAVLQALVQRVGSSESHYIGRLDDLLARLKGPAGSGAAATDLIAEINKVLRSILRPDILKLFVFIDDYYLFPSAGQPQLLDYIAGMLRDCDGWIKVATIERLTRLFEHSSRIGLEVPHDASTVDLDVTLENPAAAQKFLESVLATYTETAGTRFRIAKPEALGRLVLASGGVPRDYLNLLAGSIVAAREKRAQAAEIGKEDVAGAAGTSARRKKRDLEQDVDSVESAALVQALEVMSTQIKGAKHTYFKVDFSQKSSPGYEILARLVDLRFAHLVQSSISDQHRAGTKYEAYVLALSEYSDVRLHRGLNNLDIDSGKWVWRMTGKAGTSKPLTAAQLRTHLRQAPVLDVEELLAKM